jgi:16S rRNA (guanine527-N7)-methyltransferase
MASPADARLRDGLAQLGLSQEGWISHRVRNDSSGRISGPLRTDGLGKGGEERAAEPVQAATHPTSQESVISDSARRLPALRLAETQIAQLLTYLDLLQKWNKVYNLTAIRNPDEMVTHHLLDCLAAMPALAREIAQRPPGLLDVGSGGGLPGIVIAICFPELKVDCVDTVAKKAAFIQQAAASLGLSNLRGVHSRVEQLTAKYGVITSRAFASLPDFVALSCAALAEEGVWMAMKGKLPDDEIAQLPSGAAVFHVEQLQVPHLDAERCLVWMRQVTSLT